MCLPTTPFKVEKEWIGPGGLHCAVVQAREGMNRCGYVRVPPSHPYFGKGYDDVDLHVHGGLTFAELEPCVEHEDGQGWWFGFDCAHYDDMLQDPKADVASMSHEGREAYLVFGQFPSLRMGIFNQPLHYWTLPEVVEECEQLALQLVVSVTPIPLRKYRTSAP